MRYLAAEDGPHGIRVCGIWTAGVGRDHDRRGDRGRRRRGRAHRRPGAGDDRGDVRPPPYARLADVAEVAAFLASDRAAGITGSMTNVDRRAGAPMTVDLRLELVLIPVTDIDRAKAFYVDRLGFNLDVDHNVSDEFRVVQMTPPGSACSITIGRGITDAAPGSYRGTHLVVDDIVAARAELVDRGVEVSDVRHFEGAGWEPGPRPRAPAVQLLRRLQGPGRQHVGPPGGQAGAMTGASAGRVGLRHPGRAPPAGAARPLLPDAGLVRRGRGRGAGDAAAGVAGSGGLRRQLVAPGLALPHRHQRVPRPAPPPVAPGDNASRRSPRCRGSSPTPTACSTRSRPPPTDPTASPSTGRRSS